jgi:acetyl esterase/lipase
MTGKNKRMALWALGIVALLVLAGWLALQWAISNNGPAVLNAADRITGGARSVEQLHKTTYGDDPAQKIIVFGPDDEAARADKRPVIIFAHGGSWSWGDPDDYTFIARALVPEGYTVVLIGYRLYPAAKFPAMLQDTASAIAWVKANIAKHGGDPDRISLAGHSAGAYNVVMTALDKQWLAAEGLDANDLTSVIGLAGPYDFYPFDSESTVNSFGDTPDPQATQPINAVRGDAPPMLLIHGDKDTLVRPRNSRVLAEAITKAGGKALHLPHPEMDHNHPLMMLASPYRSNTAVLDAIAGFPKALKPSVPVQDESR